MSGLASARAIAIAAAHETCPRCSAGRTANHAYCLECGFQLPRVDDGLAKLRRAWLRTVGWYPGDWVWVPLLALLVAAGGAAAAITFHHHHAAQAAATFVAPSPPAPVPQAAVPRQNGQTEWPAGRSGWTVVLLSAPERKSARPPVPYARAAARAGLPQVGVLESSGFSSLHPGYYVVFSGIYGASNDADIALETVRARGYGGAYVVQVTP